LNATAASTSSPTTVSIPLSGRERRRWLPIGHDRADAEAVAARLANDRRSGPPPSRGTTTVGEFLTRSWMPNKRRTVRATTAYRYAWFIDRYITPAIGEIPLRRLRADHLDDLYDRLTTSGGRHGNGLAPKTIADVHMIIRAALDDAVARELLGRNVAHHTRGRRRPPARAAARSWTAAELSHFLTAARSRRLYPALHLAAHTGTRRGEIVGLRWSDLDHARARLSISRTIQNVGGQPVEFGVKTRTSRRTVELDHHTVDVLVRWRHRLRNDRLPHGADDWVFCNRSGRFLNPESISQLFDRVVQHCDVPRIRFHDLRHTHASLLIADRVAIKVVSERLGHAHPAFTMHTYQHLLPGMSPPPQRSLPTSWRPPAGRRLPAPSTPAHQIKGHAADRAGRRRR
jgi:integrase